MRTGILRLSLLAAISVTAVLGASASSASAMYCAPSAAPIKFSPGLADEVPAVQKITVKGGLTGCTGGLGEGAAITSGTYVAHLTTIAPQGCKSLGESTETVVTGTEVIKWHPGKLKSEVSLAISTLGATGSVFAGFAEEKHLVSGAEIRTFEPIFIGVGEPCTKKNRLKTVNATFSLLHIE